METIAFHWRCFVEAARDLRAFAREHAVAAAFSVVISAPAIPLAAHLGSDMSQEIWGIVVQSLIGPLLLILLAFVFFWLRAPAKLWRTAEAEAERLRGQPDEAALLALNLPHSRIKVSQITARALDDNDTSKGQAVFVSVINKGQITGGAPSFTAKVFSGNRIANPDELEGFMDDLLNDAFNGLPPPEGLEIEPGEELNSPVPIIIEPHIQQAINEGEIPHFAAILRYSDRNTPAGREWVTMYCVARDPDRGEWRLINRFNRTYLASRPNGSPDTP